MKNVIKVLASGFGLGYIPWGPGTFGTFLGVPLFVFVSNRQNIQSMLFVFFFCLAACVVASMAEKIYGQADCQKIVIDEVAGILVATCWLPVTWQTVALAVPIFRTLDIFKPDPIGFIQRRIKGGVGIVADDVASGIITNIVLQIIYNYTDLLGNKLY